MEFSVGTKDRLALVPAVMGAMVRPVALKVETLMLTKESEIVDVVVALSLQLEVVESTGMYGSPLVVVDALA